MLDLRFTVNEILGEHNVDKQITDSKGDVSKTDRVPTYRADLFLDCLPHGGYQRGQGL